MANGLRLQYDPKKAAANLQKHRVSFAEAFTVFGDEYAITVPDLGHSEREDRSYTLGMSAKSRLLFVVHTEQVDDYIRIISARKATAKERRQYEEKR